MKETDLPAGPSLAPPIIAGFRDYASAVVEEWLTGASAVFGGIVAGVVNTQPGLDENFSFVHGCRNRADQQRDHRDTEQEGEIPTLDAHSSLYRR